MRFLVALTTNKLYALSMTSMEIISLLEENGWVLKRTKGSHHQFKHPTLPGRVTVVHPTKDFPIGTLKNMEKQSGLKFR
jgi:predicted RNA binding protein YcfA (HicA-like mRNA interferase family)